MMPRFTLIAILGLVVGIQSAVLPQRHCAASGPIPTTLLSSQRDNSPEFIGSSSTVDPLRPKARFQPEVSLMHNDGGNTGSTDFPGPKGHGIVETLDRGIGVILWSSDGHMISSFNSSNIGAYDPISLQLQGSWTAPAGHSLSTAYMVLLPRNNSDLLLVGSNQGSIFVVQKGQCKAQPHGSSFGLIRHVDVAKELGPSEVLFNNMVDIGGNIWFTTGGFSGTATSTTLGFVTPDGLIRKKVIPGQIVENGIAVSRSTVFIVTGPPRQSRQREDGFLWAYTSSSSSRNDTGLELLWKLPYNAGPLLKPGTFARGSGTTPALLGDDFVAVTDNDDEQLHLIIAHQKQQATGEAQLVCKVPIFEPGVGAADVRPTVHFDGHSYRVAVLNSYQAPPMTFSSTPGFEINGDWNNRTGMIGGIASVEVGVDGQGCRVVWTSSLKVIMAPILSTSSGLFYTYVQEPELARQGLYVWYVVALDWRSGKEVWRLKAGTGGAFNDNALAASIGLDGTFYQPVFGGTVTVKDG